MPVPEAIWLPLSGDMEIADIGMKNPAIPTPMMTRASMRVFSSTLVVKPAASQHPIAIATNPTVAMILASMR